MAKIINFKQSTKCSAVRASPSALGLSEMEMAMAEYLMRCLEYLSASAEGMRKIQRDHLNQHPLQ